jgi:hypothetical protein
MEQSHDFTYTLTLLDSLRQIFILVKIAQCIPSGLGVHLKNRIMQPSWTERYESRVGLSLRH